MIRVTDHALMQLVNIRNKKPQDTFLRVAVKGGGCSGFSYKLNFTNLSTDSDLNIQWINTDKNLSLEVLIDEKSLLYLTDVELDYHDGLNGKGFQFVNPNAKSTCGCGESFSI